MGAAGEGTAAERLLRKRAARRDVGGLAGLMRHLLRHHRRSGLRVGRCGQQLDGDRARSSGGAFGRGPDLAMIRVTLPAHLRKLARVEGEVTLEVAGPVTQRSILDALEARYPVLRGTVRDHVTQKRRAFIRFFACEQDLSNDSPDAPVPEAVMRAAEPFMIVGA